MEFWIAANAETCEKVHEVSLKISNLKGFRTVVLKSTLEYKENMTKPMK